VLRGLGGAGTVTVRRARDVTGVAGYDAVLLGSAVYLGQWLDEVLDAAIRCGVALEDRPVWLFSCAPGADAARPPTGLVPVADVAAIARSLEHVVLADVPGAGRGRVPSARAARTDPPAGPAAGEWGYGVGRALAAAASSGPADAPVGAAVAAAVP
jgi:menaquinone-dependent protoporphyrinogen oxidase